MTSVLATLAVVAVAAALYVVYLRNFKEEQFTMRVVDAPVVTPYCPQMPEGRDNPVDESMTKKQLFEIAKDLDIHGRSYMNKAELIDAINGYL